MTDTLETDYPEGAPYIRRAVAEHGEAWVLEHYYQTLYPLGRVLAMPEKHELPFFDDERHEEVTEADQTEMYEAWATYRENLRSGAKPRE